MTIYINRRPRLPGGRYAVAGLGLDSGCPLAASKSTRPTNTTSALCHLFSRFSREEENARTLLGGRLRSRMKWKCEELILLKYERPSSWHFATVLIQQNLTLISEFLYYLQKILFWVKSVCKFNFFCKI